LNVPEKASAKPLLSGLYAGVVMGTKPSSASAVREFEAEDQPHIVEI
jgi:hypothetical protein